MLTGNWNWKWRQICLQIVTYNPLFYGNPPTHMNKAYLETYPIPFFWLRLLQKSNVNKPGTKRFTCLRHFSRLTSDIIYRFNLSPMPSIYTTVSPDMQKYLKRCLRQLQNICKFLPEYMVPHPGRLTCTITTLKLQISKEDLWLEKLQTTHTPSKRNKHPSLYIITWEICSWRYLTTQHTSCTSTKLVKQKEEFVLLLQPSVPIIRANRRVHETPCLNWQGQHALLCSARTGQHWNLNVTLHWPVYP
jgi:hypothetical protein